MKNLTWQEPIRKPLTRAWDNTLTSFVFHVSHLSIQINGERVDGNDLKFAEDCLERARPVVTVVIKQFRSETESKYVLCSPTESDHEVPTNTSRVHGYNMAVVPPKERLSQVVNSYNPDFLPSDETSPENVPTGVLYPEVEHTPEIQNSGILSSENEPSAEPPSEPIQLNISHEPAQESYNRKHAAETWSADDSYEEEKITTFDVKEREDDATHVPEEYPSDDDELLLKVGYYQTEYIYSFTVVNTITVLCDHTVNFRE